jgi:hypothetical protein
MAPIARPFRGDKSCITGRSRSQSHHRIVPPNEFYGTWARCRATNTEISCPDDLMLDYLRWLRERLPNRPICLILDQYLHISELSKGRVWASLSRKTGKSSTPGNSSLYSFSRDPKWRRIVGKVGKLIGLEHRIHILCRNSTKKYNKSVTVHHSIAASD